MPIALPAIGGLVLVLWVIALALGIAVIIGYIAGVLHGLPFPLNQLAGPVNSLAKGITDVSYKAIHLAEKLVGAGFHLLAQYMDRLWNELVHHSAVSFIVSQIVGSLVHAFKRLEASIAHAVGSATALLPRVKTLEREWRGIEAKVKQIEREIGAGIGHDLRIQIKALEQEVTGLENKVIPNLRSLVNTAENDAQIALKDVEAIPFPEGVKTWAEAIAVALPALGLEWLRCNSNPFKGNPNGCSLWGQLAKLLPLGALLAIGFSFQEFVDAAETVAGGIGTFVGDLEKPFVGELPPLPPPKAV